VEDLGEIGGDLVVEDLGEIGGDLVVEDLGEIRGDLGEEIECPCPNNLNKISLYNRSCGRFLRTRTLFLLATRSRS
jgi:hypothetical protein